MHGWCTDDARMMHGWCTDDARMMHGWCMHVWMMHIYPWSLTGRTSRFFDACMCDACNKWGRTDGRTNKQTDGKLNSRSRISASSAALAVYNSLAPFINWSIFTFDLFSAFFLHVFACFGFSPVLWAVLLPPACAEPPVDRAHLFKIKIYPKRRTKKSKLLETS